VFFFIALSEALQMLKQAGNSAYHNCHDQPASLPYTCACQFEATAAVHVVKRYLMDAAVFHYQ
jgi:hypothetical protein